MATVPLLRAGVLACAVVSASVLPCATGAATAGAASGRTTQAGNGQAALVARAQWRPDAAVQTILVAHKRVYIAGDFTHLRNTATGHRVARNRVAAFDRATGVLVKGFHPRVNHAVKALAVLGHKLVLGGEFTVVNGKSRQHLAAVNARSGHLTHWTASVDGPVWALLSMRGEVYVGGKFATANAEPRSSLFALDSQAALSATWPDQSAGLTDHWVNALAASADRHSVLVGGSFHTLVGSPRSFLGAIARGSGDVREWDPAPVCTTRCFVHDLAVAGNRIYAGVGGPGGAAVAYRADTADTIWSQHASGNVNSVALAGKHLVIGGHFTRVHQHHRPMFAELSASSGRVTSRKVATSGRPFPGIEAVDVHDRRIRLGGDFVSVAGQRRFAVLRE
jgi:trimeric autotransporter adhesin